MKIFAVHVANKLARGFYVQSMYLEIFSLFRVTGRVPWPKS
jgi:hypothetical protein